MNTLICSNGVDSKLYHEGAERVRQIVTNTTLYVYDVILEPQFRFHSWGYAESLDESMKNGSSKAQIVWSLI